MSNVQATSPAWSTICRFGTDPSFRLLYWHCSLFSRFPLSFVYISFLILCKFEQRIYSINSFGLHKAFWTELVCEVQHANVWDDRWFDPVVPSGGRSCTKITLSMMHAAVNFLNFKEKSSTCKRMKGLRNLGVLCCRNYDFRSWYSYWRSFLVIYFYTYYIFKYLKVRWHRLKSSVVVLVHWEI